MPVAFRLFPAEQSFRRGRPTPASTFLIAENTFGGAINL
jgi:hypothetical protein